MSRRRHGIRRGCVRTEWFGKHSKMEQAELAGLKIEPFVRNVILGVQMKPRPKEEWAELLRQTSGIANNINQITRHINSGAPVDAETLRLIADMQAQIWATLKEF